MTSASCLTWPESGWLTCFFFQAEDGIRDLTVTGVQTCALPIYLVVLPGSKSTMADLAWLHATGLAAAVVGVAAAGRPVLGVCGGFQMLGGAPRPPGRAGPRREAPARLGLLPVPATLRPRKRTRAPTP